MNDFTELRPAREDRDGLPEETYPNRPGERNKEVSE